MLFAYERSPNALGAGIIFRVSDQLDEGILVFAMLGDAEGDRAPPANDRARVCSMTMERPGLTYSGPTETLGGASGQGLLGWRSLVILVRVISENW